MAQAGAIVTRMPGAIQHDESSFPLVIVTWTGDATDADFQGFFDAQRRMLARQKPYVQIADASNAKVMSSLQRRMIAQFSEETEAEAARWCKGTAVVIKNAMVRGAMTAVLWLVKLKYPLVVVATFEEALDQARGWASAAGIAVPTNVRRAFG